MVEPPSYPVDFYSDELVLDPHVHYRAIRDLGPAVYLPRNDLWAICRYQDVRSALRADEAFISGKGVSANQYMNNDRQVATLVSDGDRHLLYRKLVMRPITAPEMRGLRDRILETAESLIDELLQRRSFDGMTDLAQIIPVSIVSRLVGLPERGRENMLKWAAGTFDTLGSLNPRGRAGIPAVQESFRYAASLGKDDVDPAGWARRLFQAADDGVIDVSVVPGLLQDYIAPSLDTAIFAIGHMLYLLGNHPEQWQAIRADPRLVPSAINEALRYDAPLRSFTRYVTRDFDVGGQIVPQGSRVIVSFSSANRDERKYPDPDKFDIFRNASDHFGFGHGVHTCLGVHLARLELGTLFDVMARRVERIVVGEPTLLLNNILRGYTSLPVELY